MEKIWVVVADGTRGRIFEVVETERAKLREIENLVNPEGHEQARELTTDAQGRFHGKGQQYRGHAAASAEDAVEHADAMFARTIGNLLSSARSQRHYEGLRIFAPPKFLGLLRQNLDKETGKIVEAETPKDISWLDMREIEKYIKGLH